MRRAAKVDANQQAIIDALRSMGCSVDINPAGGGVPDLDVGYRGTNFKIEVKSTGGKLNALQKKWHANWRGKAHIAYSVDDALNIMRYWKP